MEQELNITYRGIESNPSDYACVDGGLSECIGLDVRNGEIVNAVDPLLIEEEKGRLLGYHDVGDSRNKIVDTQEGLRIYRDYTQRIDVNPTLIKVPFPDSIKISEYYGERLAVADPYMSVVSGGVNGSNYLIANQINKHIFVDYDDNASSKHYIVIVGEIPEGGVLLNPRVACTLFYLRSIKTLNRFEVEADSPLYTYTFNSASTLNRVVLDRNGFHEGVFSTQGFVEMDVSMFAIGDGYINDYAATVPFWDLSQVSGFTGGSRDDEHCIIHLFDNKDREIVGNGMMPIRVDNSINERVKSLTIINHLDCPIVLYPDVDAGNGSFVPESDNDIRPRIISPKGTIYFRRDDETYTEDYLVYQDGKYDIGEVYSYIDNSMFQVLLLDDMYRHFYSKIRSNWIEGVTYINGNKSFSPNIVLSDGIEEVDVLVDNIAKCTSMEEIEYYEYYNFFNQFAKGSNLFVNLDLLDGFVGVYILTSDMGIRVHNAGSKAFKYSISTLGYQYTLDPGEYVGDVEEEIVYEKAERFASITILGNLIRLHSDDSNDKFLYYKQGKYKGFELSSLYNFGIDWQCERRNFDSGLCSLPKYYARDPDSGKFTDEITKTIQDQNVYYGYEDGSITAYSQRDLDGDREIANPPKDLQPRMTAMWNVVMEKIRNARYAPEHHYCWYICTLELYDGSEILIGTPFLYDAISSRLVDVYRGSHDFTINGQYTNAEPYFQFKAKGTKVSICYNEKEDLSSFEDIVSFVNIYKTPFFGVVDYEFDFQKSMRISDNAFHEEPLVTNSEETYLASLLFQIDNNRAVLSRLLFSAKEGIQDGYNDPQDFFRANRIPFDEFIRGGSYDTSGDANCYDNEVLVAQTPYLGNSTQLLSSRRRKMYNNRLFVYDDIQDNVINMVSKQSTSRQSQPYEYDKRDAYLYNNRTGELVKIGNIIEDYVYSFPAGIDLLLKKEGEDLYIKLPTNKNDLLGITLFNPRQIQSVKELTVNPRPSENGNLALINCARSSYYNIKVGNREIDEEDVYSFNVEEGNSHQRNYVNYSYLNSIFMFDKKWEISVGEGEVMAIASMTKALSEGQFGQFPLVCFCTDGVYALDIANDGTIASVKPMNRQKILHRDAYVECDDFVCFVSQEGVMMMDGSQIINISEAINGRKTHLGLNDNLHLGKLIEVLGEDFSWLTDAIDSHDIFLSYMEKAKLAYDGVNRRILFYRSDSVYCYCYSLNTKYWTAIVSDVPFRNSINDYPDTLLQGIDNKLYRLNVERNYTSPRHCQGFMITRPLSFGDKNILKSIRRIIHRGTWDNKRRRGIKEIDRSESYVRTAIWGSRDLVHWVRLRSLRGTSMKYYRVAFFTNLKNDEAITASSYVVDARWANKIR